jgi:hypothetical protein
MMSINARASLLFAITVVLSRPDTYATPVDAQEHGAATTHVRGDERDPFARPLAEVHDSPAPQPPETNATGLSALAADEVVLNGVLLGATRAVAVVRSVRGTTHVVRPGDRLRDGKVHAISREGLLIVRDTPEHPALGPAGPMWLRLERRSGEP